MTTNEILGMSLAELQKKLTGHPSIDLSYLSLVIFFTNHHSADGDDPVKVTAALKNTQKRLTGTTVSDVISGWNKEADEFLSSKKTPTKIVHLLSMYEFLKALQFVGLPQEEVGKIKRFGEIPISEILVDFMDTGAHREARLSKKTPYPGRCDL